MNTPLKRLRVGLILLALIFVVAVVGYRLAGWSTIDSIYMVVVTLSSVGFREIGHMTPALKVFTILLIVFGVSIALYTVGGFVQMTAEGEINRAFGLRRVTREIQRLKRHVIICGFGRMGEILAGELHRQRVPFVVHDNSSERIAEATSLGYLARNEDATEEEVLLQAGIRQAKTLVAALPGDADNVFITLTARNLNPRLQIIARAEFQTTEKKLIQAGADRVVLPATTGAQRMAAMITRPSAIDLTELAAHHQVAQVEIDELPVPADSPLVGCTIGQFEIRSRFDLLIVAIRRGDGELTFNPGPNTAFHGGDNVIVMGRQDDIDRFRRESEGNLARSLAV